jgi:hypothetical protein
MENGYSALISIITVLGSAAAFRYYEKRAIRRERDEDFIRHDCKDRIAKLEALLLESATEKDEMRKMILEMTSQLAELKIKVEYLSKENDKLAKTSKKQLNG